MINASRRISAGLPLLVLLAFSSLQAWSQALQKETLPGALNYHRMDATAACGGVISLDALSELKRRGFAAVVDFQFAKEPKATVEAERKAALALGLKYINLPMMPKEPDAEAIVEAFLKAVKDPANLPIYIHSGEAHRAGALWAIKRVRVDGWTVERALAEAQVFADQSVGWRNMREFVLDYVKVHPR